MFSRKRGNAIGQAQPDHAVEVFRGFGVMRKARHTAAMGKYDDAALGARASVLATAAKSDRVLVAVAAELQLLEEQFAQEGKEAAEALRLAQVRPYVRGGVGKESWSLLLDYLSASETHVHLLLDIDGQWTRTVNYKAEKVSLGTPVNELDNQFYHFVRGFGQDVVNKMSTNLDANGRFEPDTLLPTAIANIGIVNGEFVTYDSGGAPFKTLEEGISRGIDDLIAGRRR